MVSFLGRVVDRFDLLPTGGRSRIERDLIGTCANRCPVTVVSVGPRPPAALPLMEGTISMTYSVSGVIASIDCHLDTHTSEPTSQRSNSDLSPYRNVPG